MKEFSDSGGGGVECAYSIKGREWVVRAGLAILLGVVGCMAIWIRADCHLVSLV